jgi:predicted dienelactone hydrolase
MTQRIRAVFAIAPDLGNGFKSERLNQAQIPVLLIVGGQNSITPSDVNKDFYYSHTG